MQMKQCYLSIVTSGRKKQKHISCFVKQKQENKWHFSAKFSTAIALFLALHIECTHLRGTNACIFSHSTRNLFSCYWSLCCFAIIFLSLVCVTKKRHRLVLWHFPIQLSWFHLLSVCLWRGPSWLRIGVTVVLKMGQPVQENMVLDSKEGTCKERNKLQG